MQKLANMRQWSERMSPNFAAIGSRPNMNMANMNPHQKTAAPGAALNGSSPAADPTIHFAFNVPLASDLAGPNTEDILHATGDSVMRWTHPGDAPDDIPVYELPVHTQNVDALRNLCQGLTDNPLPVDAHVVTSAPPSGMIGAPKSAKSQVVTVCLSGDRELVHKSRETILSSVPLALVGNQPHFFILELNPLLNTRVYCSDAPLSTSTTH